MPSDQKFIPETERKLVTVVTTEHPKFRTPSDLDQALSLLRDSSEITLPLAGATWIMRAHSWGGKIDGVFVDLSAIPGLRDIEVGDDKVSIGSMATQEMIANALADQVDMTALTVATGHTANPAIRRAATIGGNICTVEFSASDIVPALLALEAEVEFVTPNGWNLVSITDFLAGRRTFGRGFLVTRVVIPRRGMTSNHSRTTLRKAGDYPVANLSAAVTMSEEDGTIRTAAVAVGGVEAVAKRWDGFEKALLGRKPDADEIRKIAADHVGEFKGRDATGAPGWYRVRLLPALAERAFRFLLKNTE